MSEQEPQQQFPLTEADHFAPDGITPRIDDENKARFVADVMQPTQNDAVRLLDEGTRELTNAVDEHHDPNEEAPRAYQYLPASSLNGDTVSPARIDLATEKLRKGEELEKKAAEIGDLAARAYDRHQRSQQ